MTKQDLYELDQTVWNAIQRIKKEREIETTAYIEGLEKGSDLMLKAVKEFLENEQKKEKK